MSVVPAAAATNSHLHLLSLLILSSPTERGQRLRCFQRTLLKQGTRVGPTTTPVLCEPRGETGTGRVTQVL